MRNQFGLIVPNGQPLQFGNGTPPMYWFLIHVPKKTDSLYGRHPYYDPRIEAPRMTYFAGLGSPHNGAKSEPQVDWMVVLDSSPPAEFECCWIQQCAGVVPVDVEVSSEQPPQVRCRVSVATGLVVLRVGGDGKWMPQPVHFADIVREVAARTAASSAEVEAANAAEPVTADAEEDTSSSVAVPSGNTTVAAPDTSTDTSNGSSAAPQAEVKTAPAAEQSRPPVAAAAQPSRDQFSLGNLPLKTAAASTQPTNGAPAAERPVNRLVERSGTLVVAQPLGAHLVKGPSKLDDPEVLTAEQAAIDSLLPAPAAAAKEETTA